MAPNGSRPRTAADVAQLESDNEYLANENERLTRELAIITADRSRLQVENALLDGKARESLISATRMETIVRQVSSGLVAALAAVTQERTVARTVRRHEQEEVLAEETGAPPAFLRSPQPVTPTPARVESDQDRQDRLRGAAERVLRPGTRIGQIDHTLAERDSRLPQNQFDERAEPQDLDELAGKSNGH